MKNLGVYIHIPFCAQKCAYCDFYSLPGLNPGDYADAVIRQIEASHGFTDGKTVDTVFFGGGTPSYIPANDIKRILDAVKINMTVSPDAEISIEANPGTLDETKLNTYLEAGINRMSLGLQSANDDELKLLSRIHTKEQFEDSYTLARKTGFKSINIDVMYALPFQTKEKLHNTLEYVTSVNPEHLSVYGLKIEPETPFGRRKDIFDIIPDDDTQADMYLDLCGFLEKHGYAQYEISNFSKPGFECRHNLKYWNCEEYAGFGPGAYSLIGHSLFSYKKDLASFIKDPVNLSSLIDENEYITDDGMENQFIMLSFRLSRGLDEKKFAEEFGVSFTEKYGGKIDKYLKTGIVKKTDTGYALTRKGMLVSNYYLSDILDFN